jgi:hypothetical protein
MEREIVAHVFEATQVRETERRDERQLHVEDTVFVVGSEDEIAVGVAGSLLHIFDF